MIIWFKLIKEDKIIKDLLFKNNLLINKSNFEKTIRDICYQLDIGCPLLLNVHFKHFSEFNIAKFLSTEFIESVDFDFATAENIIDKKENKFYI